ncbi:Uncharacterised protein [Vibrio cholerae]|nr:Uncharacterised protein [Vibrio cholerae]CSI74769.1 Uncharacterised protein [Vibrio cholerae]
MLLQSLSNHHARRDFRQRSTGCFRNKRHSTRSTWVYFNQVNFVVFDCKLNVHQATNTEFKCQLLNLLTHLVLDFLAQGVSRQRTG